MNLYFKSSNFKSNKDLADFIFTELKTLGIDVKPPQNEEFMFVIESTIENESVFFYMGKNDEPTEPTLWQAWPEQNIPILKRIFKKVDKNPEKIAKAHLETTVKSIQGVSGVEWGT